MYLTPGCKETLFRPTYSIRFNYLNFKKKKALFFSSKRIVLVFTYQVLYYTSSLSEDAAIRPCVCLFGNMRYPLCFKTFQPL